MRYGKKLVELKKKKKREKEKSIRDEKLTLDKVIFYAR